MSARFNLSDPGKGMEKLLDNGDNLLTFGKSTIAIMTRPVIKRVKKQADKLLMATSKTVLPAITAGTEAQEEASCLNIINQLVICVKESAGKAITTLAGSDVTDASHSTNS